MKIVRLLFFSALFLFLLVTAISLFIPSRVRISRAVNLAADPTEIWRQVDSMQQWPEWNPFFSSVTKDSIHFSEWQNGAPTIMEVQGTKVSWKERKPDERVARMEKKGQNALVTGWRTIGHNTTDSTTLQWYMDFKLDWYPWEKFASLLLERSYGTRMEEGLANLKKRVHAGRVSNN